MEMTMLGIDLNCDMGEGFGVHPGGDDLALLEYVTSANIACGFHAGDPAIMSRTVKAAAARGVAIGAHPGLPDLQGFGRRVMHVSAQEVYDLTVYQVGALRGFTAAVGVALHHVKAHGALYNMAARDVELARALCRAVRDVSPGLVFYALAGSAMVSAAEEIGLAVAREAFADRSYQDDGTLTPRGQPGAMIADLEQSITQVRRMLADGVVHSLAGRELPLRADTICIHGDQPGALDFARGLATALRRDRVALRAPAP